LLDVAAWLNLLPWPRHVLDDFVEFVTRRGGRGAGIGWDLEAKRTGLKIFDPLELIDRGRIRRDLLVVDQLAFDEEQLALARRYAELLCNLHGTDARTILRRFDDDLRQLSDLDRLKHISLRRAAPSAELLASIQSMERGAAAELERRPQPYRVMMRDGSSRMIDPLGTYVMARATADLHRARCLSGQLSRPLERFIPLATGPLSSVFEKGERNATVLRVVLSNLPVPAPETPLARVVGFTSDPKVRAQLCRMRAWVLDMSLSPVSAAELEASLADYSAAMSLHECEAVSGRLECVLTTTAQVLTNAGCLRLGKVVKQGVQLCQETCALTEAELASPCREVAFIDSAARSCA
jgi:hypothetical protein